MLVELLFKIKIKMPPRISDAEMRRKVEEIFRENPEVYEGYRIHSFKRVREAHGQFEIICPAGHIFPTDVSRMQVRHHRCGQGECRVDNYKRRGVKQSKTKFECSVVTIKSEFNKEIWKGYRLLNIFQKIRENGNYQNVWIRKKCPMNHITLSRMRNFMTGQQCSHTVCKMQKMVRTAFGIKKYLWDGTEEGGFVRYMGYEHKLTLTTEECLLGLCRSCNENFLFKHRTVSRY